ncbi:MAG: acetyl-CoA carboxylase biotin carboxylase subunit [candidate division Zixibacteria bacterium]|nr:acetyl-CoA carboxylase biotin carboxylase subunit [candidate division Zixibacteria bacterium]
MFKKVLIANRGEIALRIIRACRELDIRTVAVYSEADRSSLHVRFADEGVCIGPPQSNLSYLDPKRIIAAAEVTNADAIHPGYGFLAENADFAEICQSCKITFIGPSPEMIRNMGDKAKAKAQMKEAGTPIIPGSDGIVTDVQEAQKIAEKIGFPVMIKASAGGGGRGMRLCFSPDELAINYETAGAEAQTCFGNSELYLEKAIVGPHHVEIQLMGDKFGNIVHFGERDCSIQRRHQKLLEESPSPIINPDLRARMGEAAVLGAHSVNYHGAGTVEFLVDQSGKFFFMEMNTRIQVEHPVTEQVTGVDLVKEQIRVAAGEKLSYGQSDITFSGHAIECRINAEDPEKDFRPCPGRITSFHVPGGLGVRVDTAAYAQYEIPPYYDSLIAKLIVHAPSRQDAITRMRHALEEFVIEGIPTTIDFQKKILSDPGFIEGKFDTSFVDRFLEDRKKAEGAGVKT